MKKIKGVRIIQNVLKAKKELLKGNEVTRFEFGDSMRPILLSGEYAHLVPFNKDKDEIKVGDGVFCEMEDGYLMIHMVGLIDKKQNRYLIVSTSGTVFGWTNKIIAKAKSFLETKGKREFFYEHQKKNKHC